MNDVPSPREQGRTQQGKMDMRVVKGAARKFFKPK